MQKIQQLRFSYLFVNEWRFTQNNDWVIFTLTGCAVLYLFMMISLQKDIKISEYILQKFPDSNNRFISWVITSLVTVVLLALLISQYIPMVPKMITNWHILGFELNKVGYTLLCLFGFYFLKTIFSYIYYQSTGNSKTWPVFYFTATKFYFIFSLLLFIGVFCNYYFSIDRELMLKIILSFLLLTATFKIFFYFFHYNKILPQQWYYKFLYICTLQIIPIFVLWKCLFF